MPLPGYPDLTRSTAASRGRSTTVRGSSNPSTNSVRWQVSSTFPSRPHSKSHENLKSKECTATCSGTRMALSPTITINREDFEETLSLMKELSEQLKSAEQEKQFLSNELENERRESARLRSLLDEVAEKRSFIARADELLNRRTECHNREEPENHELSAKSPSNPRELLRENKWMRELLQQNAQVLRNLKTMCEELKNGKTENPTVIAEFQRLKQKTEELLQEVVTLRQEKDSANEEHQKLAALQKVHEELQIRYSIAQNNLKHATKEIDHLRYQLRRATPAPQQSSDLSLSEVRVFESMYDALVDARLEVNGIFSNHSTGNDFQSRPGKNSISNFDDVLSKINSCFDLACIESSSFAPQSEK